MEDLIQIQNLNGKAVTSSLEVAKRFNKEHCHVIRDIETLVESLKNINGDVSNFGSILYLDSYRRYQKMYQLTRDGFTLLVMRFTGGEALQWQVKYIEAFSKMEEVIKKESMKLPQDQDVRIRRLEALNDIGGNHAIKPVDTETLDEIRYAGRLPAVSQVRFEFYLNAVGHPVLFWDKQTEYGFIVVSCYTKEGLDVRVNEFLKDLQFVKQTQSIFMFENKTQNYSRGRIYIKKGSHECDRFISLWLNQHQGEYNIEYDKSQ